MADENLWRSRFYIFMAARLFGLAMIVGGIAVAFTDLLREGGWPQVGAVLAILGALDALLIPKILRKVWERQDRGGVELPRHDPPEWQ